MRKLELLPEVLPAPTPRARGNARDRTVAHMQRMLAAAAAVSCSKGQSQTQTVVIPPATTDMATADPNATAVPTATAVATATSTTTVGPKHTTTAPTITAPPTGYAVVDPMPAPARCAGLAAASTSAGTWKIDPTGLFLEVVLQIPAGGSWAASFQSQPPSAWGATLITNAVKASVMTIRVRQQPGATSLGISVAVTCSYGPGHISPSVPLGKTPKSGDTAQVSLTDY